MILSETTPGDMVVTRERGELRWCVVTAHHGPRKRDKQLVEAVMVHRVDAETLLEIPYSMTLLAPGVEVVALVMSSMRMRQMHARWWQEIDSRLSEGTDPMTRAKKKAKQVGRRSRT